MLEERTELAIHTSNLVQLYNFSCNLVQLYNFSWSALWVARGQHRLCCAPGILFRSSVRCLAGIAWPAAPRVFHRVAFQITSGTTHRVLLYVVLGEGELVQMEFCRVGAGAQHARK